MKQMPRLRIPADVRRRVVDRFKGRCGYCGDSPQRLQVDHVQPFEYGGTNDESNLMPACFGCNNHKMSWGLEEFRRELAQQVERGRKYSLNFRMAEKFGLIQVTPKPVVFFFERKSP